MISMIATKPTQAAKETDAYFEQFERFESAARQPSWLFPLRKAGFARFAELGFPTTKDEDWRFTNVAPIASLPFRPLLDANGNGITADALDRFTFAHLNGPRLVFIDGHFASALSTTPTDKRARVTSLGAALDSDSAFLEKHLGRYAGIERNAFAALNSAFFQDGAFIHVPPGVALAEPIRLLFVSTGKEAGATTHPRNLIIADKRSRVTVIESFVSAHDAPHFTNTVTELVAGDDAVVEHLKFQDESDQAFHIATVHGEFGRHSRVKAHSFALGARLSRNNIHTRLAGEGLECVLNGLYLTKGSQLADHHMVVEHAQPRCASHEYFNGILDDKSKGVFHGRILVQSVAQKTDAKQTNKNILLSDDATVDTKPQLEIYADDVKCTHGATVGQLDEDAIYYLRSRGVGLDTAKQMLIHAFAGEIIDRVKCEPAREELDKLIWHRLEENPHIAEKK
jgi:Fe-S cluster assembly protein SufD